MIQVVEDLAAALSPAQLTLYYAADTQLSTPILIFHGSSTTTNNSKNSSRIQIHVLTNAGFQSYTRLTVAPNSEFYAAVDHLPRENQSDEVCRGMAFGLLKYFHDLPQTVKTNLALQSSSTRSGKFQNAPMDLFKEEHVADLVRSMVRVENISDVVRDIQHALKTQNINHVDADLVLPSGSITALQDIQIDDDEGLGDGDVDDPILRQYGAYGPLVKLFGEVSFLPTSKLKRAPSRPTSLNRTKSFLKDQKVSLRREMGEFVDTEERYVIKMHDLVNQIAEEFREKAKKRSSTSLSPSSEELEKLFPNSLDRILQANSSFLIAIQKVMDDTEEEAMQDLEADAAQYDQVGSRFGNNGKRKDPTGALAFAKVLLEWLPQFSDCYQEYIRASQDFPKIITRFITQQSSFSQRVQQTGEQKLRSAIIEPVQRLPRYSLFIDNIVNYLPISHPALQPLLKARDVVTSICSLDSATTDKSQAVKRLRNVVEAWPQSLLPRGRLISATDFVELPAPYDSSALSESGSSRNGIFLLFSSCVVILRKLKENGLSARGVIAEVDKPSATALMGPVTAAAGGQKHVYDLAYAGWYRLVDIRFTESSDGQLLWMMSSHELRDPDITNRNKEANGPAGTVRAFVLKGAYEGKISKWTEDVTKARIEGRFSEKERETEKWSLRNVVLKDPGFSLYTAIFEEGIDTLIEGRKDPAPIRIVVDYEKGTKGAPVGHYGIDIVANVTVSERSGSTRYRLQVDGLNGATHVNDADAATFMPLFAKRLGDLLQAQHRPGHPTLTASFNSFYSKVLGSLNLRLEGEKSKSWGGSVRPSSPVKMISNFLSASTSFGSSMSNGNKLQKANSFGNVPSMPPPNTNSLGRPGSSPELRPVGSNNSINSDRPVNQLMRLEETCTGYIAALQVRKGNVVGKVLRNRATADELFVNDLYNSFIENPHNAHYKADEASVDVLFMAFEKFLNLAWKEHMGPVLSLDMLKGLLDRAGKLFPVDFENYVRSAFSEMAPQNRRAFIALVKLLADLLDGCGNDGDRGALTITFAELLVPFEASPHDFVNLLDRMVEDCDKLFDDNNSTVGGSGTATPSGFGSLSSRTGTSRSTNTGSLTSNASSLRRKLGFDTLLRQNSKQGSDSEQKSSIWGRSRSKSRPQTPGDLVTGSLSKGSLQRSKSIERGQSRDGNGTAVSPRRAPSRDRPTVIGAFDFNERPPSSGSGHRLSTIGASPPPEVGIIGGAVKHKKKKRRSSLSDLKDLMSNFTLEEDNVPGTSNVDTVVTGSGGPVSSRVSRFNTFAEGTTPVPFKLARRPLPSPSAANIKVAESQETQPKQLDSRSKALPDIPSPTKISAALTEAGTMTPKTANSPKKEHNSLYSQNASLSSPFGPPLRRREGSVASISPERHSPFGSVSRNSGLSPERPSPLGSTPRHSGISPEKRLPFEFESRNSGGGCDLASGLTERDQNVQSESAPAKTDAESDVADVKDLCSDPTKPPITNPVKTSPVRGHSKTLSMSQIPTLRSAAIREMAPVAESNGDRERRDSTPTLAPTINNTPVKNVRDRASTLTTTSSLKDKTIPVPSKGLAEARKDSTRSSHISKLSVSSHSRIRNQSISSNISPRRVQQREVPSTPLSPNKLRLQSPTKLRDRNSEEQKAIDALAVSLNDEIDKLGKDMSKITLPAGDAPSPSKIGDPFANFKFPPKTPQNATGESPTSPPALSPSLMPPLSPTRKPPPRRNRVSSPPLSQPAATQGSPYPAPLSPVKRPSLVSAHASFPPQTHKASPSFPTSSTPLSPLAVNVAPEITSQLTVMQHRIQDLESRIPKLISNLTSKNEEVKKDLSNLLETEQYRVRELDQLYKEAVAENELLYERFGGEIGKIVKALRAKESTSSKDSDSRPTSKDGSERRSDLVEKIQEGMKEMSTVRNENARLKREVIGLKTLLKGNGIPYHNSDRNGSVSSRGGNGSVRGRQGSGMSNSISSNGGRPGSSNSEASKTDTKA